MLARSRAVNGVQVENLYWGAGCTSFYIDFQTGLEVAILWPTTLCHRMWEMIHLGWRFFRLACPWQMLLPHSTHITQKISTKCSSDLSHIAQTSLQHAIHSLQNAVQDATHIAQKICTKWDLQLKKTKLHNGMVNSENILLIAGPWRHFFYKLAGIGWT